MQFIRYSLIANKLLRNLCSMSKLNIPLVVIIGATGCGKTKISLQIAKQFNCEIISADSMQVYKGLDVITNKATLEERQQIPHHLIDFLDPLSRFSVVDFRERALKVIDKLMSNNKIPVIVGGTNYYIESILWNVLIDSKQINKRDDKQSLVFDRDFQLSKTFDAKEVNKEITKQNIFSYPINYDRFEDISSQKLFEILKEVDPKAALSLHPNDKRKIIRSLQVFQQNGKLYSELIADQRSVSGGSDLGGPLRYRNAVILWLDCDKKVLNERLDQRVDDMIENGLIDELLDFHKRYNSERLKQNLKPDYTKGIFQSIGLKEFHNYLLLNEDQRKSPEFQSLFNKGVEDMKIVTKRYVNKQLKWIRNRFLKLNDREVPHIYRLNVTNLDQWTEQVSEPAFAIVNAFINGTLPPKDLLPLSKIQMNKYISTQFNCDVCKKILSGSHAYELHLKSKGHKYNINHENNLKRKKYYQLISLLNSHTNNLLRRNSF